MKPHPRLTGTQVGIVSSCLVVVVALLLQLSACTSGPAQTAHTHVTPTTRAPTSAPTSRAIALPTGGPAPQDCPHSGPLETKTVPPGWGGNSGPWTLIGKGLAWGGLPPNETFHFKDTGNGLKIVWAVGPLLHNEVITVHILNLATGDPIPAGLVTSHGPTPTSDKIVMGATPLEYFYNPQPGWYVWGSYFEFPAPGCYQLAVQWPGGQWSENFPAGD
jgi:hypothetical protein